MTRLLAVASVLTSLGGLIASCSPCTQADAKALPPLIVLTDGGMGAPCASQASCAAGLECQHAWQLDSDTEESASLACTRICDSASPCPTGFACVDAPLQAFKICLPSCRTSADCNGPVRVGSCVGPGDGGLGADAGTDGGVPEGICQPVVCGSSSGTGCPSGSTCQSSDVRRGTCSSGGGAGFNAAPMPAPRDSWCGVQ